MNQIRSLGLQDPMKIGLKGLLQILLPHNLSIHIFTEIKTHFMPENLFKQHPAAFGRDSPSGAHPQNSTHKPSGADPVTKPQDW